jgi:acyl-[acyl-carrier-protein]-phospholipid O-acyltransferase/long-chain-fatty-acid--[acyl-carrier-protein] ligase
VGRLDEDGFLFIEGRMSRFSKIAGEMVPHLTLENKIVEALDLHPAAGEGLPLAVMGVPDEKKGESLVLLTTSPIDIVALRKKLLEMGLTSLWIPKVAHVVPVVPILASGKLDMRECLRLAKEAVAPAVSSVAT